MAYTDTFYIYSVPVTCTGSGSHDWITADFKIVAAINSSNTAYDVNVYARIDATGRMNWTGDGILRVTCNGKTSAKAVVLEMRAPGVTIWDGPASFVFGAPGEVSLNMNIDLDLTSTTGTNGNPGPTHNSDGGNMQHFYYNNYSIKIGQDGGLPPLIVAPTISKLINTNQHNNNSGISASTNSISVSWSESGTITNRYYRLNGGSWKSVSSPSVELTSLSEGTSYTIETKSSNSAGDSNILSTVIRTKYNSPVVTLTHNSNNLDSMTFKWTSDKSLASSQYKINEGAWTNSGTGTSGTITIEKLSPNTKYTVYFKGVSTSAYDSLNSNEVSSNGTTLDMARITDISDCIFGTPISISIKHPSSNTAKLKIWTTGNSRKPEFEINVVNGKNTFNPTQSQLDEMYKCFTTSNSIPIYFSLTTVGKWSEWDDVQQNDSLELTGIAKTAHIGVDNLPKRAQAWIGVDNIPKRSVEFIGVNGIPKRCI